MVKEKWFKGFLILNWKTGNVRAVKSKLNMTPYEIRVPYNIKISMPELQDVPMNIDIKLPTVDTIEVKM